jgi:hypothetical protein
MRPKDEIHQMIRQFKSTGGEMLKLTHQKISQYEGAKYGVCFAKASKRLAVILSVDREVLVLFTNFTDQQARTVNFAKEIINKWGARLESTIAVIVHKDKRGSRLLKNWGRGVGLSVLPVYIEHEYFLMHRGLEKILSLELFSHDPFDVTGPVSDDSQFYGRRTEAIDLARKLRSGQIRSILGIRKIGKTSMINRVIDETLESHGCKCIMIDCSKDMVWNMNSAELMQSIANAINSVQETGEPYLVVDDHGLDTADIVTSSKELEDAILQSDSPVILFWDEVDYITPSSSVAKHWVDDFNVFWRNFRAVYQEVLRHNAILSLLVSSVSSKWFTVEAINDIENAALAFIPDEYVSPLPRGATTAMIKRLGKNAGLSFTSEAENYLSEVCADMPYWVRKASSYIHGRISLETRPCRLNYNQVVNYLTEFVKTDGATIAQVALRHLFSVYPELEQAVYLCSEGKADEVPKYHLAILQNYGIISKPAYYGTPDSEFSLSGQMLKEGYKLYLEREAEKVVEVAPAHDVNHSSAPNEWAEELALINRRRNLLEKRLRQVVLNFIRFDSLSNQQKDSTAVRISEALGGIQKNRKIANLSAEEIIEKTTWLQLTELIRREWRLFERIFGDRQKFLENCSIINERYDAHAKDFDLADMALYRRSLKHLEDAISKL